MAGNPPIRIPKPEALSLWREVDVESKWSVKSYLHSNIHCSLDPNSGDMEATEVPIDGWVDKEDVANTYSGILLSPKKKEVSSHATTWMNLEVIVLSETNQSQKDT